MSPAQWRCSCWTVKSCCPHSAHAHASNSICRSKPCTRPITFTRCRSRSNIARPATRSSSLISSRTSISFSPSTPRSSFSLTSPTTGAYYTPSYMSMRCSSLSQNSVASHLRVAVSLADWNHRIQTRCQCGWGQQRLQGRARLQSLH